MTAIERGDIRGWQFDLMTAEPGLDHIVTDRKMNGDGEFTLSYSSSPDRNFILQNRKMLADALGVAPSHLFFPSQVHKTRVVHVHAETIPTMLVETDALITNEAGIAIAVLSADCVPILLYDKVNHAIGAVHSGWRGTVTKILTTTLDSMHHAFGTKGGDVVAAIGPAVCQQSYEVGVEVVEEVVRAYANAETLMMPLQNGKALFDLWEANRRQLLAYGVMPSNIEVSNLCTVKNNAHFFSARKGDVGRFCAAITLGSH